MIPSRGSGTTLDTPRGGLARRLAASVYESLLLGALTLIIGFVLLPLLGPGAPEGAGSPRLPLPSLAARATLFTCLFLAYAAYCAWLWSGGRRSLPMRTWRLALARAGGAEVRPARALLRYFAWWIGPACALAAYAALRPQGQGRWAAALLTLNYAWALVDPERQFLHDRLAGTRLTRDVTSLRAAHALPASPK